MNVLTKRFPTILGLVLLLGLVVGIFYYFQSMKVATSTTMTPSKVRITNIADNKFSVTWVTQTPTSGAVEYGTVGDKLAATAKDERDSGAAGQYITHQVSVEGLQPSTQYAFRILVGTKPVRFDNNGSPYTTSTGPVIGATPASQNFYGNVQQVSKQAAGGAIVYLTLPGGATASTLVRESGNYAFTLSTMRAADLRSFVQYDPTATIASVSVEAGSAQSTASVSLANSAPVPTITLGQNADFLNGDSQVPAVAEVQASSAPQATGSAAPVTPAIFNVEPLAAADVNEVSDPAVVLLNPKDEGETLTTLRPEFRGTGPVGLTLSIALTGQKAVSDNTSTAAVEPAFVASPSATTTTSTTTTTGTATADATRVAMPATGSGMPVTGVIEDTVLTAGLGIVTMIVGAMLFAL